MEKLLKKNKIDTDNTKKKYDNNNIKKGEDEGEEQQEENVKNEKDGIEVSFDFEADLQDPEKG